MVIRASSARHIDTLLDDLRSDRPVVREAAVARLTVIGERAVDRLAGLASDATAPAPARVAAFRALEGIGHPRALDVALPALAAADADVALAAIGVARTFLSGAEGLRALDALTGIALERARPDAVRGQALRALGDLGPSTLGPVFEKLLTDPSASVRALARGLKTPATETPSGDDWLERPDEVQLPDDPDRVRAELAARAGTVPLPLLHRTLDRLREREQTTTGATRRRWMGVRAAVHVALAARGSRLGVYDLRESLESATEPLPVEFLSALTTVGDASCLESIAGAYSAAARQKGGRKGGDTSRPADQDWWHRHLGEAFEAIVTRDGITRRHAVVKKIEKRWPEAFIALWPARSGR